MHILKNAVFPGAAGPARPSEAPAGGVWVLYSAETQPIGGMIRLHSSACIRRPFCYLFEALCSRVPWGDHRTREWPGKREVGAA